MEHSQAISTSDLADSKVYNVCGVKHRLVRNKLVLYEDAHKIQENYVRIQSILADSDLPKEMYAVYEPTIVYKGNKSTLKLALACNNFLASDETLVRIDYKLSTKGTLEDRVDAFSNHVLQKYGISIKQTVYDTMAIDCLCQYPLRRTQDFYLIERNNKIVRSAPIFAYPPISEYLTEGMCNFTHLLEEMKDLASQHSTLL